MSISFCLLPSLVSYASGFTLTCCHKVRMCINSVSSAIANIKFREEPLQKKNKQKNCQLWRLFLFNLFYGLNLWSRHHRSVAPIYKQITIDYLQIHKQNQMKCIIVNIRPNVNQRIKFLNKFQIKKKKKMINRTSECLRDG